MTPTEMARRPEISMNSHYLLVFANLASGGTLKPGMSGGDRIAIECLRRWTHAFQRMLVLTTLAGKAMYVRNAVPNADYVISTRIVLPKHSLPNNIILEFLTTVNSLLKIPSLLKQRDKHLVLYSTSDFPGDSLPALAMKILRPKCFWLSSFYLFAPSPWSPESPYHGAKILRAVLWIMAQRPILALMRRFADMVLVTNELDKQMVADGKRLTIDRVIAVRGGVDLKLSEEVLEPPVKNYDAVFIGRLHPQKGVLELVKIWKLVCSRLPKARLAVIGNGELEDELRSCIDGNGLAQNIEMFGFMDGREKIRIFKQSKIVLHPAIYDSGGMASAEAMACGLPGICFDLPVLRTYYPKGMIRVPRNDLGRFAEAIVLLLNDSKHYSRLSQEAMEQSKSWDWDNRADNVLEEIRNHPLLRLGKTSWHEL